jgi:hypothetical protein
MRKVGKTAGFFLSSGPAHPFPLLQLLKPFLLRFRRQNNTKTLHNLGMGLITLLTDLATATTTWLTLKARLLHRQPPGSSVDISHGVRPI